MNRCVFAAPLMALATSMIIAGCGSNVDTGQAEKEIKNGIASKTGSDVKYVKCPDSVNAKTGGEFHCDALVPVTVKQVDENGSIRWQIASLSGPPGTTGASGPTGATNAPNAKAPSAPPSSPAAGGATGGGGSAGGTSPAAAEGRLTRFRNPSAGYSILHPVLWKQTGSGVDVSFVGPASRFLHLFVSTAPVLTPAQVRQTVTADPRYTNVGRARAITLGGTQGVTIDFVFKSPTGRQQLHRYLVWRGRKQILIEIGSTEKGARLPRFRGIVARVERSFRWL